mmetsp:Transcript_16130/g.33237  ORF Transcript_16130/g.33237 Transcript_16130/m.33237 type:complete len:285 (-) Transcript_16130:93-947(-)
MVHLVMFLLVLVKQVKKDVALKCIPLDTKQKQKSFAREVKALRELRDSPYIVQIKDTLIQNKVGIIVTELCKCNLFEYITSHTLSQSEKQEIFKQVCYAVKSCHDHNIAHLDIKPGNILIDESGNVKLCDFGSSYLWSNDEPLTDKLTGTQAYQAPEVIGEQNYSPSLADSWTLGVLLHIILTNQVPFGRDKINIKISSSIKDHDAKDLITSLLQIRPHKRLQINEILNHKYINNQKEHLTVPLKEFNHHHEEKSQKKEGYARLVRARSVIAEVMKFISSKKTM